MNTLILLHGIAVACIAGAIGACAPGASVSTDNGKANGSKAGNHCR
jgi:hypothetical protein